MTRIYVLKDPNTNEVRYVGLTIQPLKKRLMWHTTLTTTCLGSSKKKWLESLCGKKPIIKQVEQVEDNIGVQSETKWISYFLDQGCVLTNDPHMLKPDQVRKLFVNRKMNPHLPEMLEVPSIIPGKPWKFKKRK